MYNSKIMKKRTADLGENNKKETENEKAAPKRGDAKT